MALLLAIPVALIPGVFINAIRPEVYAPTFAMLVWSQVYGLRFIRHENGAPAWALLSVFLLSLAAGFHPAIALATGLPLSISILITARRRLRVLLPAAVALVVLASLIYLYLPSRALAATPPALVWGDPTTPGRFWNLITAALYQGNFEQNSIATRLLERLSLLAEGPGIVLLLVGFAGLSFGALTRLRGATTLLATSFSVLLAGALQSHLNPDMRAYLAITLVVCALGMAVLAMALFRSLPLPEKRDWHSAVLVAPAVFAALLSFPADSEERDRTDDAMQLWDETVSLMPPGPGLFFASGDHSLFVAQYERLVAGARPDIAIVSPELVRDLWFIKHVQRMLSELYLPYLDDGTKGNIAARLYWENASRRRPVWGDALLPAPVAAIPVGRGFRFATEQGAERADVPPAPLVFTGMVGKKVATLTALRRAEFESAHGRPAAAAVALGVSAQVLPRVLADNSRRPSLYPFVPESSHDFLVPDYATALMIEDIVWQLGGEALDNVGTSDAERTHLAWRLLLSGDTSPAESILDAMEPAAQAATTPMLLAIGRVKLAEERLRARIAIAPKDADSLAVLASLLGNKGDAPSLQEAQELFLRALAAESNNSETWTRLGLIYIKQGDTVKARNAWNQALRLEPTRNDVINYLRRLDTTDGT